MKKAKCSKHSNRRRFLFATIAAAAVVALAVVVVQSSDGSSTPHELKVFADAVSIDLSNVVVEGSVSDGYRFSAAHALPQGTTVFHIPRHLCITEEDIRKSIVGRAVQSLGSDFLKSKLTEFGSSANFHHLFLFAMVLVLERRNPLSPFQMWFRAIPNIQLATGALYWNDVDLKCLDGSAFWEADALRKGWNASYYTAKTICDNDEETCGPSPTRDELRWALSVYLQFNIQDQAIVPFVTFASFTSLRQKWHVLLNKRSGGLDVVLTETVAKGDLLTNYFPRGPSSQLVSRGTFDPFSLGVDTQLDISSALAQPKGRKICGDNVHQFMFGANGRPREALIACYGWLIASPKQRKDFERFREDTDLMRRIFADFQETLKAALSTIPAQCNASSGELQSVFDSYLLFTKTTLEKNLNFVTSLL